MCPCRNVRCLRCDHDCPAHQRDAHDRDWCWQRRAKCDKCQASMPARELFTHNCTQAMQDSHQAMIAAKKKELERQNAQLEQQRRQQEQLGGAAAIAAAAGMGSNFVHKVVVIGDSGVGKTALLKRWVEPTGSIATSTTIGTDFVSIKQPLPGGQVLHMQVWDTAGQERYQTLTRGFFRHAAALVICFDYTRQSTLRHTEDWLHQSREDPADGTQNVPVVLVGCKSDLQHSAPPRPPPPPHPKPEFNPVTDEMATATCERIGAACLIKTSAMSGTAINEVFERLATLLVQSGAQPSLASVVRSGTLGVDRGAAQQPMPPSKGCC